MKVAFIVSTYNQAESLRKCLLGILAQTYRGFETLVADDGSGPETAAVIRRPEFAPLKIRHIWQADIGFRKTRVMNLAVASTDADYCVFIDGDTVPRADYVETHLRNSRPRCYLSGSRVNIPPHIHAQLSDEEILSNRMFELRFLTQRDPRMERYRHRLGHSRWKHLYDFLTYRPRVWFGSNSSGWRQDILKVNGWNETFGYGSEDRELGMRLSNAGVYSNYLKFTLIQAHLDHPVSPNAEQLRSNRRRFQRLYFVRETWSPLGIDTVLARERLEQEQRRHQFRPAA